MACVLFHVKPIKKKSFVHLFPVEISRSTTLMCMTGILFLTSFKTISCYHLSNTTVFFGNTFLYFFRILSVTWHSFLLMTAWIIVQKHYETIGKRELFLDKKKITWPGKTAFNKGWAKEWDLIWRQTSLPPFCPLLSALPNSKAKHRLHI